jgi:hypothetical protein
MGVDYLTCNYCEKTFNDCGYYVSCDCGMHWCSDKCAIKDKYKLKKKTDESSCKYCREEDFNDVTLLKYALKELKLTRKQLVDNYKISI